MFPISSPLARRSTPLLAMALASGAAAQPQIRQLPPPTPVIVTYHGGAVAALPDVNGDGVTDVAVASFFSVNNIGRVYVYSGANGQLIRQLVSPNQEIDDLYGSSVAAVPDADGDGVADIVVGAPMDSPGTSPQGCGRAYLYSGATGRLLRKLLPPSPRLFGQFGYAVAGLRDLDGDGRGDIAVGAPEERSGQAGEDIGRVHIYSGATGARLRTIIAPTDHHSGEFGHSLASIGDLSGDGRDDLIIGDHRAGLDTARGGLVYFYASTGERLRVLRSPQNQDDGRFGYAVAAVPDANNDGRPDIAIGAPREFNRSGRAYLFSGASGGLLAAVRSPGLEADARFGEAVAGLPDFNGDGRGDFIVGAPHEDPGFSSSDNGRAYVYSGIGGRFLQKLIPPSGRAEEYFGFSLAGLPDTNGNGRPEIVVGAPGDDSPTHGHSGAAYIFRY